MPAWCPSSAVKSRPRISGRPSVAKYPGATASVVTVCLLLGRGAGGPSMSRPPRFAAEKRQRGRDDDGCDGSDGLRAARRAPRRTGCAARPCRRRLRAARFPRSRLGRPQRRVGRNCRRPRPHVGDEAARGGRPPGRTPPPERLSTSVAPPVAGAGTAAFLQDECSRRLATREWRAAARRGTRSRPKPRRAPRRHARQACSRPSRAARPTGMPSVNSLTPAESRRTRAQRPAQRGERRAFDEQLPNDAQTARAERRANRDLAGAAERPGEHQVRGVGARDQDDEDADRR